MTRYAVEIMSGDKPTSIAYVRTASSPQEAAEWVTARDLKPWQGETDWVRVTDQANQAVYKYAFKQPATANGSGQRND